MGSHLTLDEVKADRATLVRALKDAGAEIHGDKVRCPFPHDGKPEVHPSGSVHVKGGAHLYTCHGCTWNGGKRTGDVIAVVRRVHSLDFHAACERLGISTDGRAKRTTTLERASSRPDPPPDQLEAAEAESQAAHQRLLDNPEAIKHLCHTRGVPVEIVERFRIGITGQPGCRFWTFPITVGGRFVGLKAHRADGQDQKSWWRPKGVGRDHLFPAYLEADGPVWVCPGELKALAVASVGRAAVGITSGEGAEAKPAALPLCILELLRDRRVAVVCDDDATGQAWGKHVCRQLCDAGIDARIVDLDLDAQAGQKDLGDWIVRHVVDDGKEPEAVAATLDDLYRRADPWFGVQIGELWTTGRMWQPVTLVPTGFYELDATLGDGFRTGGVTLLAGKAGHAKTQLAVTMATNAARGNTPTAIFSLELGADEVAQLVAAQLGSIPRRALATGKVGGDYALRLRSVQAEYNNLPLAVLDDERWPNGLSRNDLADLVARGVKRFGWRLVVLDYLGLLLAPESDRSDYQTDLRNSSTLKRIARKHNVALVVVAALRKGATLKQSGKKSKEAPAVSLDDVLGAGRLVYDAQNVLYVYTEHGEENCGLVHVRPLKLRFAPMRDDAAVSLRWRPVFGAIMNFDEEPEP